MVAMTAESTATILRALATLLWPVALLLAVILLRREPVGMVAQVKRVQVAGVSIELIEQAVKTLRTEGELDPETQDRLAAVERSPTALSERTPGLRLQPTEPIWTKTAAWDFWHRPGSDAREARWTLDPLPPYVSKRPAEDVSAPSAPDETG